MSDDTPDSVEKWGNRLEKGNHIIIHFNALLMPLAAAMGAYHAHKYMTMEMYAAAYWALLGTFIFLSWFASNAIDVLLIHGYLERVD